MMEDSLSEKLFNLHKHMSTNGANEVMRPGTLKKRPVVMENTAPVPGMPIPKPNAEGSQQTFEEHQMMSKRGM